jgi:hypothetical protein
MRASFGASMKRLHVTAPPLAVYSLYEPSWSRVPLEYDVWLLLGIFYSARFADNRYLDLARVFQALLHLFGNVSR